MFIRSIMGYSELAVFEGKMDLIDRRSVEHVFFFRTIIFLKIIYLFLGRGEGKEKDRERNIDGLPLTCPPLGTWPATQACALTGNQTMIFQFVRQHPTH